MFLLNLFFVDFFEVTNTQLETIPRPVKFSKPLREKTDKSVKYQESLKLKSVISPKSLPNMEKPTYFRRFAHHF